MRRSKRAVLTIGVYLIAVVGMVQSVVNLTPVGTITVDENSPVTLTCTYVGSETDLLFKWVKVIGEVGGEDDKTEGNILISSSSCSLFGSNTVDTTKYSYCCIDDQQVVWTINNFDRSNNEDKWKCLVSTSYGTENSDVVSIETIVPIQNVIMTQPAAGDIIGIEEDTELEFICRTDGIPVADIKWYKVNGRPTATNVGTEITRSIYTSEETSGDCLVRRISSLTYRPKRSDNGTRVYCSASNVDQTHISTRQPQLNVLYRAIGPIIEGTFTVTENTLGKLTCRTPGGNPLPTLSWSCYSGSTTTYETFNTVVSTTTWTASRYRDRTCTCKCTSVQEGLNVTKTVSVQVKILYSASTPDLKVNARSVDNTVKVILNTNLRIQCSSSGKPTPSYTWTLPDNTQQQGEWLVVNDVQKSDKGQYTCRATNNPGTGQVEKSSSTTVEVQYGPEIEKNTLNNQSAEKGESFSYRCPYTPGNPALTFVKWTRAKDDRIWNSDLLTISTVSKCDVMIYTCTVSNIMEPTNKDPVSDPKTGQFYLDVKYKASVTSFNVGQNSGRVTITENTSPTLVCKVKSDPASNMKILFKNKKLTENTNALQLTHQISNVSCSNIGVYKCTGGYYLNAQTPSTKDIELFVKCKPQAYGETVTTVYTALHNPATLRLHSLAYPTINSFTWTKLGTPDEPLKNSTKVSMNMSRVKVDGIYIDIFQLDLVLNNVSRSDSGRYKLLARNDQGTIEKVFVLEPEAITENPTSIAPIIGGAFGGAAGIVIVIVVVVVFLRHCAHSKDKQDSHKEVNRSATPETNRTNENAASNYDNVGGEGPSEGNNESTLSIEGVVSEYELLNQQNQDTTIYSPLQPSSRDQNKDKEDSHTEVNRSEGPSEVNNESTLSIEGVISEYELLNQQNQDTTIYSPLQPSSPDQSKENNESKSYENLQVRAF